MHQYAAGQHVLLNVPTLSYLSHPFTINPVVGRRDQMRIIFRETGDFTEKLGHQLCLGKDSTPVLHLSGYYGPTRRVADALQHDAVVLVAGGIGVVPYLTVIDALIDKLTQETESFQADDISLHWICRDSSLIRFVLREHLDHLRSKASSSGVVFRTTIYQTGTALNSSSRPGTMRASSSLDRDLETLPAEEEAQTFHSTPAGEPFVSAAFASERPIERAGRFEKLVVYGIGNCAFGLFVGGFVCLNALNEEDPAATIWIWLCVFSILVSAALLARTVDTRSFAAISSVMWSGLLVIWVVYLKLQDENGRVGARLISPIAVVAIAASVAVLYVSQTQVNRDEYKLLVADRLDGTELMSIKNGHERQCDFDVDCNDHESTPSILSSPIAMVVGRPLLEELLTSVEAAKSVGMFSCGPAGLMQDLRDAVQRRRHCLASSRTIRIYEQSFET